MAAGKHGTGGAASAVGKVEGRSRCIPVLVEPGAATVETDIEAGPAKYGNRSHHGRGLDGHVGGGGVPVNSAKMAAAAKASFFMSPLRLNKSFTGNQIYG